MALISKIQKIWAFLVTILDEGGYYTSDNVEDALQEIGGGAQTISGSTVNIYVNASTGDDNNDGQTASTPFLTLQKAYNEAARKASAVETVINATGTFEELVVPPKYGSHTIRLKGSDLTDPSQTTIEGLLDNPAISTAIDARATRLILIFEGIRFNNSFYAVRTQNSNVTFTGCQFNNVSYWIQDAGFSTLAITSSANYTANYSGFSGTNFAILVARNSSLSISGSITATTFDRFITLNGDGASLTILSGTTQNWTHKAGATFGPFTIFTSGSVRINIQSSVTASGNDATPDADTSFIYFNNGHPATTFFLGGISFNLTDFDYVYNMADQGTAYLSDDDSINYNLTNVTNIAKLNIGSTAFDATSVAATDATWQSTWFDSNVEIMKQISYFNS